MDRKFLSRVLKAAPGAAAPPKSIRSAQGHGPSRTYPAAACKTASRAPLPDPTAAAQDKLDAERAALAAERTRLEQAGRLLQTCASALTSSRAEFFQHDEERLVDLVLKIATLVIQDEVAQRPELIASQVQAALTRVKEDGVITVRVHPQSLGPLREAAPRLVASLASESRLHVEPDASIALGGCLVETPQCIVDARLAGQMAVIGDALRRELSEDR